MKKLLRLLRGRECSNGISCPRIYELPDGNLVIQGVQVVDPHLLAELGLPAHEAAVTVPRDLLFPEGG